MQIIRTRLGIDPLDYRTEQRLVEVHFGDWQGHTIDELEVHDRELVARRYENKWLFKPPGTDAESYQELAVRVQPWLQSLNRPTVCVTHGGVIRTLFHLIGKAPGLESAQLTIPQDQVLEVNGSQLLWRTL